MCRSVPSRGRARVWLKIGALAVGRCTNDIASRRYCSLPTSGVALTFERVRVGAKSGVAHALRHLSHELGEERGSSLPILRPSGKIGGVGGRTHWELYFYSSHPVWFWGTGTHVSGPAVDRGKGVAP
uniref:Uncharacterized protein n=1 Tax=Ananas comosus var. bracteatus TaxID=296719 RepID=A0A6V7NYU6_ANACO|nr:unnamed protein product [Ananas comosus var. bracteatus]